MAKKTSLVEFADYTEEDAEEDMNEQKRSRGGAFFKFPEDKTRLRIVPAPAGKKWKIAVMEHFFDVPGVGSVKFVCPKHSTKGKRSCKVCTREKKLRSTSSAADEQQANNMRAKRRCYAKAIIRGSEEEGPRMIPFGAQIEGDLTDLRNGGYNFVDPVGGCDVIVIKRVANQRTNYKVVAADKGNACPLSDDTNQMKEWIAENGDLDRFARLYTDEEIDTVLRGEKVERQRPAKAAASGKSIGDMDEDDEDDDDLDVSEDEDDEETVLF